MNKKGQTTVDYLMTYGWALIVIVVVLGLLFIGLTAQAEYDASAPKLSVEERLDILEEKDSCFLTGNTILLENEFGKLIVNPMTCVNEDGSFYFKDELILENKTSESKNVKIEYVFDEALNNSALEGELVCDDWSEPFYPTLYEKAEFGSGDADLNCGFYFRTEDVNAYTEKWILEYVCVKCISKSWKKKDVLAVGMTLDYSCSTNFSKEECNSLVNSLDVKGGS